MLLRVIPVSGSFGSSTESLPFPPTVHTQTGESVSYYGYRDILCLSLWDFAAKHEENREADNRQHRTR